MDCKNCYNFIDEYIFEELSLEKKKEFEKTLLNCDDCKKELDENLKLIEGYQNIIETPNFEKLNKKIILALEKNSKKSIIPFYLPLIAATIIISLGIFLFKNNNKKNMITIAKNEITPINEIVEKTTSKKIKIEMKNKTIALSDSLKENPIDSIELKKETKNIISLKRNDIFKKGTGSSNLIKGLRSEKYKSRSDKVALQKKENSTFKNKKSEYKPKKESARKSKRKSKKIVVKKMTRTRYMNLKASNTKIEIGKTTKTTKIKTSKELKIMFNNKEYKKIIKLLKNNHNKEYEKKYYYKSLLKLKDKRLEKIKNLNRYLDKSELEEYKNWN